MTAERRFREGDRIVRISDHHYAGEPDKDYGNGECQKGHCGVLSHYYEPNDYDDSEYSRKGLVASVAWDHGATSAINDDLLALESPPVTPDEEAAAIASILKGADRG